MAREKEVGRGKEDRTHINNRFGAYCKPISLGARHGGTLVTTGRSELITYRATKLFNGYFRAKTSEHY